MPKFFKIFSIYGIEAEYMIVDQNSLKALPISDKLLKELNHGTITNQVELGKTAWSNELVKHVIELKCEPPFTSVEDGDLIFHNEIQKMNKMLTSHNAKLLPTAMHPWFNPNTDTKLWDHENMEIYDTYNSIFDCRGHGWSNLQSIHINLPFATEKEFATLHAAVRLVLPIIPYFSASSPYVDGETTNHTDNRLLFYEKNQKKIPSIIGNIIPEHFQTLEDYQKMLDAIYVEVKKHDPSETLCEPWINSRGAIVKFDVRAIEMRLMDIQESSYMDFCLINLFCRLVKKISQSDNLINCSRGYFDTDLRKIYDEGKKLKPELLNKNYCQLFTKQSVQSWADFRRIVIEEELPKLPNRYHRGLQVIAEHGNLSERLLKTNLTEEKYHKLAKCLEENDVYE